MTVLSAISFLDEFYARASMEPSHTSNNPEILANIEGGGGVITLNRPKALNALSLPMIRKITGLLMEWKDQPEVRQVIICSSVDNVFCAGGDIRSVYEARLRSDQDFMSAFFQEQYLLDFIIYHYPKPCISFIEGLALGGGLGISVHGSHRIVTEKTLMGMPETGIGFFPDVGAGHFLNRCPGKTGIYLGLSGDLISGEDALYMGLATHRAGSGEIPALFEALKYAGSVREIDDILQDATGGQRDCFLQTHRALIDRCFSASNVEGILEALIQETNPVAQGWLKCMEKKSPTSLKLALSFLQYAKNLSLKQVLSLDFRISQQLIKGHDFFEGIRAAIIDKDKYPQWNPSRLEDVLQEQVDGYFQDSF